jgi:hypothetical protein
MKCGLECEVVAFNVGMYRGGRRKEEVRRRERKKEREMKGGEEGRGRKKQKEGGCTNRQYSTDADKSINRGCRSFSKALSSPTIMVLEIDDYTGS